MLPLKAISITWHLSSFAAFTFCSNSYKPLVHLEPNLVEMLLGWSTFYMICFIWKYNMAATVQSEIEVVFFLVILIYL